MRQFKSEMNEDQQIIVSNRRYICKYERFYNELEDLFDHEIYASSIREALLTIAATLGFYRAETREEAVLKAEQFLKNTLGNNWTVEDFFNNDILIETTDTAYRIHYLYEYEKVNISK